MRVAVLHSIAAAAGLLTCLASARTQLMASNMTPTTAHIHHNHRRARLPLLRADITGLVSSLPDNETAMKAAAADGHWEWTFYSSLMVCPFPAAWVMCQCS